MRERRNMYRVLVGKPEGKSLKDQGVDGSMGWKWTLGKLAEGCGFSWLRIRTVGGLS
jgi:hypothetical protein